MSVRKRLIQECRKTLRKHYKIFLISLDEIQGVPDSELEEEYSEYRSKIIDDTLDWMELGED